MTDTASLKDQIASGKGKSVAFQLRTLMPDIDRRVREGVEHETILEWLADGGLTINLNTFRSNLYRYRARVKGSDDEQPIEPSQPQTEQEPARNTVSVSEPMGDGNRPSEMPETEPDPPMSERQRLDDILDAKKSEARTDQFFERRKPLIGQNRSEPK